MNNSMIFDLETLGTDAFTCPVLSAAAYAFDTERFTSDNPYTIEEIVKSDSKLLEFLNLYIDDYEILIEFAQSSFKDPVKSRLESLSKSKNLKLFEIYSNDNAHIIIAIFCAL